MISDDSRNKNVHIPLAGEKLPEPQKRRRKRRSSGARRRIRPLILLLCVASVAVVAVGAWLVLRTPTEGMRSDSQLDIVASPNGVNLPFRDGFLSVTASGYTVYDAEGISAGFNAVPLPDPVAICNEKRFFAYSRGGTSVLCADASRTIYSVTAPGNILSAAANAKNQLAVVSDAEYHKGGITVYAPDGGVLFSYRAAEVYPYLCALSPDGEVLAAAVMTSTAEGDPATGIYAFSLSGGSITGTALLAGETVASIICDAEQNITAVTENGVHVLNPQGGELASYLPENGEVRRFALGGGRIFLFCERNVPGAQFELISLSSDCTVLGRRESNSDCTSLAAGETAVALYSDGRLTVLGDDLSVRMNLPQDAAFRDAVFGTDGRLCAIYSSKILFYAVD